MKARKYYHMQERDFRNVNLGWKLCHAILFLALSIASIIACDAFASMFDIFNYKCVFFARPSFVLRMIDVVNPVDTTVSTTDSSSSDFNKSVLDSLDKNISNSSQLDSNLTIPLSNETKQQEMKMNPPVPMQVYRENAQTVGDTPKNWSQLETVPNTDYIYIYQQQIWFNNNSVSGRIDLRMMRTAFSPKIQCNFVLFTSFITMIFSTFFFILVLMCGRGGRMRPNHPYPQSWLYVYTILSASIVMTILHLTALWYLYNGTEAFCSEFSEFIGAKYCNKAMDYFTKQQKMGYRQFYLSFEASLYSYIAMAIIWFAQCVLSIMRIICMVDFQFYTTLVIKKKHKTDDEEEEFQQLGAAVKEKTPGCVDGGFADPKELEDIEDIEDIKDIIQDSESTV